MQLSLEDARERRLPLAISLLIAAIVIFQASEIWIANRRIQSGRIGSMERGAALLPGNGEAWDRIGRFWQFDFENPDSAKAVKAYQRAVLDNPNSSFYWMDLASAYEDTGDLARARQSFQQAQAVYPLSAMVAWNYGNFLVRREDYSEGYRKIREAVQTDKKLTPLAISRTWRSSEDVNVLLDQALPATTDAYLQALDFFTAIGRVDAGLIAWKRLVAMGKPAALSDSFPFLNKLIATDHSADALQTWRQALVMAGISNETRNNHSLVWNGSFANDLLNGGLGWRWNSLLGADASFDAAPPSRAGRSLRLDFSGGSNLALEAPAQYVPVLPNQTYHFHAYLRTDQITTDQGVQFSLIDPNHAGAVNLLTDNFTGSHAWAPIDADVTSGAQTHFLLIRLLRQPSRLFDNKLGGTAWIGNISCSFHPRPLAIRN